MAWNDLINGLVGFVLGASGIGAFINHSFNKKLERFKTGLQTDTKIAESYYIKQQDACAEVFKQVRIAQGFVKGLQGLGRSSTYEDYDTSDFDKMLQQLNLLNKQRLTFVALFDKDYQANIPISNNKGVREWRNYETVLKINEARTHVQEARNALVLQELFIPSLLRKDFYKILHQMDMLIFDIEHQKDAPRFNAPDTFKAEKEIAEFIDSLVDKISNSIQKSN